MENKAFRDMNGHTKTLIYLRTFTLLEGNSTYIQIKRKYQITHTVLIGYHCIWLALCHLP